MQIKFSYPIGPSKAEMTPQGYKLGSCLDFLSDTLYFIPVVLACWRYGLHQRVWPKLAAFCALQIGIGAHPLEDSPRSQLHKILPPPCLPVWRPDPTHAQDAFTRLSETLGI